MSINFKIGDFVKVTGDVDGITFTGQKGKIVSTIPMEPTWGVDFSEDREFCDKHEFYLHNLKGRLGGNTGYYIYTFSMEPAIREKTGFGKFIERIENFRY